MRDVAPQRLICRGLALLVMAAIAGCDSRNGTEPGVFSLVIAPTTAIMSPGGTSIVAVTVTGSGNYAGPVNLRLTQVPSGVTAVISNVQTAGLVTTATITIGVSGSALPGSYTLAVRGTAAGVTEATADFALTVTDIRAALCPAAGGPCEQWASSASASSEYTSTDWSANQATGAPNVSGCDDDHRAWASLTSNGIDWLELGYAESVRATEIRVHETLGISSLVTVEVKDGAGAYHTVYTAQPGSHPCPRILAIPVTNVSPTVRVVRLSFDQRTLNAWNEIDAVKLIGTR
ncbi:MAG: hypothetical protein ABIW94_10655 [Gemmatimonadaceae bacterium]